MTESKPSPLEIDVDRDDATATITVTGEIDLETSGALHDALTSVYECHDVHLDLSGVDYMDSTGLRTVLVAKGEIERAGGSLDVVAASNIVSRLIEITGIDGLIAG
jgi:anti-sigma B factor antagonist